MIATTAASRLLLSTLAAILAAVGLAAPTPALGQTKIVNFPAEKFNIAPGGVDMRSGRFVYGETDFSGGPLALTRTMPDKVANHANPFGNFSHNWDIFLLETRADLRGGNPVGLDYRMNVHHGGRSFTFESLNVHQGFAYKSDGSHAYLTYSGGDRASDAAVYTYRSDGTTLIFRPIGSADCADQAWGSGRRRCAYVSEMTEPDGTRYTFDYDLTGLITGNRARLKRVTSSRGYALLLEGSGTRVSKACVVNLALSGVPADDLCPAGASTATYSYGSGGRLVGATGPDNETSGFTYSAPPDQAGAMGFIKPGQSAPWLTNHLTFTLDEEYARQEIVVSQAFADGQTYAYGFDRGPVTNARPEATIAGGSYVDAEGRVTSVRYGFPLMPGSGATTHCIRFPCNVDAPDDMFDYVYQQTPGPVEIIDPLGRSTAMDYCDPLLLASPPPYGGCAVYPLQWSVDPEGIKTVLAYDGQRNITKATRYPKPGTTDPDGSTPAPIVTEAGFDHVHAKLAGKPLWIRDPNGNVTRWTYAPEHGGVLTETGPAVNGVTPQKRYSYIQRYARLASSLAGPPIWLLERTSTCRTGNPSGAGCALGPADEVVTAYDYGPDRWGTNLDLLGQAVTADGQTLRTCYAYDGLGRKISETSPNGTAGLSSCPLSAPTSALPYTTSTRYDADGRVTGTIAPDPDGAGPLPHPAVRNSYDSAGRLVAVEHGALAAWQPANVAPAQWPGFTDHKVVVTSYDALDRKTRVAVGGNGTFSAVTEYGYDLSGRLKCTAVRMNPDVWATPLPDKCVPGPAHTVHGADRISKNVYDEAGQLRETWDGVGGPLQRREAAYTYNGNGQKLTLADARGYLAEMKYDGFGRQQRWVFPSKESPGVADQSDYEQYLYDPVGNRTSLRKRDGSVLSFQYDALNRMIAKIVPERAGLAPAHTRDVYYAYDLHGLQTQARFDGLAGEGVSNTYDGFGRLISTTTNMGGFSRTFSHRFDREGREIELAFPDGQKFWSDRDGLGRMKAGYSGPLGDASTVMTVFYYDRASQLYYFGRRWGTSTVTEFDNIGRPLKLYQQFGNGVGDTASTFAYNPASQLTSDTRTNDAYAWTGSVAVSRSYSVNGQNQYLAAGPAAFNYDANGNLIWDSSNNYVYDVENRLVSAAGDKNASLVYDPLGRLFQISSQTIPASQFLYDGDELVAEYNDSGLLKRRYIHGDGDDDPLYGFEGSGLEQPRFPHVNHQGSVIATAGPGAVLLAINTYDEYGVPGQNQRATALASHGRFQYTGQAWLPELGMYYYKARIYSPTLGRFLQTDPIGYEGGINLYRYVRNDPANLTDPDGTQDSLDRAMRRDEEAYFKGEIDANELRDRNMARGAGGVIGAGIVAVGLTTRGFGVPSALSALGKTPVGRAFLARFVVNPKTGLTDYQAAAIAKFFGKGFGGAEAVIARAGQKGFTLPKGVTVSSLEKYRKVAERAIANPRKPSYVQEARLRAIDAAIDAAKRSR